MNQPSAATAGDSEHNDDQMVTCHSVRHLNKVSIKSIDRIPWGGLVTSTLVQ